jgi:hypothetical protein
VTRREKRRRRTRSDEPGGRTDLEDGVELWRPPRGPFAAYGTLWKIAAPRAPGYRSRLYRGTFPYIFAAFAIVIVILAIVAVVVLVITGG